MRATVPLFVLLASALGGCHRSIDGSETPMTATNETPSEPSVRRETPEQLRARLTDEQWRVTQEKDTERPFTGKYWNVWTPGTYACVVCGEELFRSEAKFDAHCGWPSFSKEAVEGRVAEHEDSSWGMVRTEVTCRRCGAHLGHVFDDGPAPTRLRYCINSASIELEPDAPPAGEPAPDAGR